MLKKRRIHAEDMCASRSAPFPVLLLSRELGFRHLQHAAATAATAEPVQQQLVENTLHLIRPQVSVYLDEYSLLAYSKGIMACTFAGAVAPCLLLYKRGLQ